MQTTETRGGLGKLLTIDEAAERLALCRSTLYQLMEAGRLRSVRYPGVRARRIPESEVERLIAEGLSDAL